MTPPQQPPVSSVRIEDGFVVIRFPVSEIHAYRVSLAECPCRAPKSAATLDRRQRLAAALGRLKP